MSRWVLILSVMILSTGLVLAETPAVRPPDMVHVTGGSFLMGCTDEQTSACKSDEKPAVSVTVGDFSIGKFEVTNGQYCEFLNAVHNQREGGDFWYRLDKYALIEKEGDTYKVRAGFADYPVTNVSWYGASAFADWLSSVTKQRYRLPTEAEWEYAARGGSKSQCYRHSGSKDIKSVAWCSEFSKGSRTGWNFKNDKGVHPVGTKAANELGIYDMSGNVSEWCLDHYENRYAGGVNPRGPATSSLRVLRGGSWDSTVEDCRVTARNRDQHISRFSVNKGFRVVMEHDTSGAIGGIAALEDFAKSSGFSGVVLAQHQGKKWVRRAFGLSNREENIAFQSDTRLPIASITKWFTATMIMQLLERGRINLNQSVGHFVPAYNQPNLRAITVHHLLTHTSGLENFDVKGVKVNGVAEAYSADMDLDQAIQKYCVGVETKPGLRFDYNNGDYVVLGKIIEKVTGHSYALALNELILAPLKMGNTGVIQSDRDMDQLAKGYRWSKETGVFQINPPFKLQNYFAAGAMYATAGDLMTFVTALFSGKLLSEQSLNQMLTTYPKTKNYAYGVWVSYPEYNSTVPKVVQRYGRNWGINTYIGHFIDHNLTVIVLANTDKVYPTAFQDLLAEKLLK